MIDHRLIVPLVITGGSGLMGAMLLVGTLKLKNDLHDIRLSLERVDRRLDTIGSTMRDSTMRDSTMRDSTMRDSTFQRRPDR